MSEKRLIKACMYCQRVYDPVSWSPLTHGFVRETMDMQFGVGYFEDHYMVSHGVCVDDVGRLEEMLELDL